MKVCPVCKARVFDDMDTCYGCLHRFDSSDVEKAHGGGFEPEEPPGYSGKARNSAEAEERRYEQDIEIGAPIPACISAD